MSNVVSSMIFCARNVDKAENQGKVGRWPVAIAQANNIFKAVADYDSKLGNTAKAALDAIHTASSEEKLLECATKGVNFLSKNINPLICVSAGLDVLTSDDKEAALATNTAALTSMFAVEGLMKKHLDGLIISAKNKVLTVENAEKIAQKLTKVAKGDKVADKVAEGIIKFAKDDKGKGKVHSIIHGVAFVIGSCTAYDAGDKFGKLLVNKARGTETK